MSKNSVIEASRSLYHGTSVEFGQAVTEAMPRVRKAIRIAWQYGQARPTRDEFEVAIARQLLADAGYPVPEEETPF